MSSQITYMIFSIFVQFFYWSITEVNYQHVGKEEVEGSAWEKSEGETGVMM